MATNKNALIRYKVLDTCFRNSGRRYFIDDLLEACDKVLSEIDLLSNGISRRQLFEDISFMESEEGWSIELTKEREGKKVFYRYTNPSFSINNMPLNEVEINQLKSAIDILSQFKGMPQFEWIHELVPKLKQGLAPDDVSNTIIEFDNNEYLKGIEFLGQLHNAIFYKQVLSISYKPFEADNPYDLVLHPYFLKQYNNRWFLFGYNSENQKFDWNLALDRIVAVKELNVEYKKNTEIDWLDYFEDIIGVTKPAGEKTEAVVLHFIGKTGNYMETKPIHGSQKSRWLDDDTLEITLDIIINYELERFILSYSDSVTVIYPQSLADRIKNRIINSLNKYDT